MVHPAFSYRFFLFKMGQPDPSIFYSYFFVSLFHYSDYVPYPGVTKMGGNSADCFDQRL